ncbi:hypothetical protein E2C01_026955 [Portunus trituberculatus]|uniref:Uncharacterized protein n=1 Tax=Portunus trituberculatus TaxID=210409 RepID=A0A5B7EGV8_PORTR|nr:hypothetical protein [Portunus trituberculatus]
MGKQYRVDSPQPVAGVCRGTGSANMQKKNKEQCCPHNRLERRPVTAPNALRAAVGSKEVPRKLGLVLPHISLHLHHGERSVHYL